MEGITYVNLIEIGPVVIEIRGAENGELAVPVNNTLVSHTAFLAADTRPCVLIILLITQSRSSVAQASSSFKCLDTAMMLTYTTPPLNCSAPSRYLSTTVLMILTVNTAACTVLAYTH